MILAPQEEVEKAVNAIRENRKKRRDANKS